MNIKSLLIQNFKGLGVEEPLIIEPNGKNVTISGQNGAGKTSIYLAYLFALGQNVGDVKPIVDGKPVTDYVSAVEVAFDGDYTLRREYTEMSKPYNRYLVNGNTRTKEKYAVIDDIDDPAILINPEYFCTMDKAKRRNILLSMCKITAAEVIASEVDLAPLGKVVGRKNIDTYAKELKDDVKSLKAQLVTIPGEIKGLMFNAAQDQKLDKSKLNEQLANLQGQLNDNCDLIKTLQSSPDPAIQKRIDDLNRKIPKLESKIEYNERLLKNCKDKYVRIATSQPGICPLCNQDIPVEKFVATRNKQIAEINEEGRKINYDIQLLSPKLQLFKAELNDLLKDQENHRKNDDYGRRVENAFKEKLRLNNEINRVSKVLESIKEQEQRSARIEELKTREAAIKEQIAEAEGMLALVKSFYLQRCKLIEQQINSKFQFVTFKLFKIRKTTGEIDEECEVLLDGKPYGSALSRGERLKASLDCLKTLQTHFKAELPVFIDDYESITSNSLLDLPNQLFRLKVVEGQTLKIAVEN